ncbi:MAG TPA: Maf family protein [Patescibacteria group bacterium]|nr:Maf family protein [Patescibacteria group bacterium]
MHIILGSQSHGRQKILREMGVEFEVMASNIDEKTIRFNDPKQLTLALAHAKAEALLPNISQNAILITSDQVVVCHNQILEKPENEQEERIFLRMYKTHPAQTVTAVVVTNTATRVQRSGVDIATVYFQPIPEHIITQLIAEKNVFTQAGGFSIDDPLVKPYIERIEGSRSSIIGLPDVLTRQLMIDVQQ